MSLSGTQTLLNVPVASLPERNKLPIGRPSAGNHRIATASWPAATPIVLGFISFALTFLTFPRTRHRRLMARRYSRVAEMERARVAFELHDGAIQSLIGLEMEVAAWLLGENALHPAAAARVRDFQRRLRTEVVSLRGLTQRLRPVGIDPSKILTHLSDIVTNFQRETGISASFTSDVTEVSLSRFSCYEAARIVQEALTNVRKHSGATSVHVTFDADNTSWSLDIEDNGFGFDFAGRRSHVELDSTQKGPAVIKERIKLLGGELTVASDPARGARLEITVPRSSRGR